MAHNGTNTKPKVLVLGGMGFIGRYLVHHLVSLDLVDKVRVVDKVIPQMAWLNTSHKEVFENPAVEFKHANLINPKSVTNSFECADGSKFDYVINCAAETKFGQSETVYKDGIYKLSLNCAQEAAKRKVKMFIEVSTAYMRSSDKDAITEDVECEPWTPQAKHKYMVEQELKNIPDLNWIVVRPALVYGIGDRNGLTSRLVIGGIYKYIQEKMKMLWTKQLKMNTVHVHDVCRALWHLCSHGKAGEIYHLADKSDTTQGNVGDLISEIFNINHDYVGSLVSNIAKISISDVIEDINDKHMSPWGEICQKDGIINTPLNPYIDQELLCEKHIFVNGSKIEKTTDFEYERPYLEISLLKEVLDDYVQLGLFPPSLVKSS